MFFIDHNYPNIYIILRPGSYFMYRYETPRIEFLRISSSSSPTIRKRSIFTLHGLYKRGQDFLDIQLGFKIAAVVLGVYILNQYKKVKEEKFVPLSIFLLLMNILIINIQKGRFFSFFLPSRQKLPF